VAAARAIDRAQITGLVLAGGRGTRFGGRDKGLQDFGGTSLAEHALQRLAPQVGVVAINANRHMVRYAALGVPVWPDPVNGFPGPLAGFLAGLQRCQTDYLVTVPCDVPYFPLDLVARLAEAIARDGSELAWAQTVVAGRVQPHPVCCLMRRALAGSVQAALKQGERQVERWIAHCRGAAVTFDDEHAFANANTEAQLRALNPSTGPTATEH
jgi:molybdenum cofactor guanylyltransferase